MIVNRIIDNAAVAAASLTPRPGRRARAGRWPHRASGRRDRLRHARGARSPEWAAWANGVAVRELDYHDTFLAAEYSHPGDNIPPILAVAQHRASRTARRLVRGIATGYEIQIDLVKAISLHKHKIDHVAHLGPSAAAGIGTLLGLTSRRSTRRCQALHTTTATRQSRKGEISHLEGLRPGASPARWRSRPSTARCAARPPRRPIYEGEDGVIAWLLDGPRGAEVRGAAAGAGRAEARDPRQLHEGALGRVPGAGADRPGPACADADPGPRRRSSGS